MRTDLTTLTIWSWLQTIVAAGILRDFLTDGQEQSCRAYTLEGLRYVDCSDRGLSELPQNIDYTAQVLILSNNNFDTYPAELRNFSGIEELDMSGNRLNRVLPSYMRNWDSLHTLNLSNNNYDTWTYDGYMYKIRTLDLSKNKINIISDDAFTGLPDLYSLDLSENRIYDLPAKVFTDANHLDSLILSRNYFSDVPVFQSSSLRSLRFSNCQITNMKVDLLAGMSSLLELDLSINEIEEVPDLFSSNTLQELDLSYNAIASINDRTLAALPHLAVLDLRGNEFKDIWVTSYFASNLYLREIYVKGNRWSCEGFSVNLLLTYEFLTREPSKIVDRASLICYSPSNVTQLTWQQAYIQTWHPNDVAESNTFFAAMVGVIVGILITSCVCRGLMAMNKQDGLPPRRPQETTTNQNGTTQPRVDSVVMRIPLSEDLPPTYDEALLMPRLNSSFHSLPDFVDAEDERLQRHRRSRSYGDLVETWTRASDRRSVRRTVEITIS